MNSPFLYIAAGIGGAIGAMTRYGVSQIPLLTMSLFPYATLAVNVLGSFVIGFVAGAASKTAVISPAAAVFWKAGFCGGLTTFSTFSLETVGLFEKKQWGIAGAYIAASIALTIAGVALGRLLALSVFRDNPQ